MNLFILITIGLVGFTIFLVIALFCVHQIAKRLRSGIHKIWPITLSLLTMSSTQIGKVEPWEEIAIFTIIHAIVWWRFEYWQLGTESPIFGKEAENAARMRETA